jgi:hypothetical protein
MDIQEKLNITRIFKLIDLADENATPESLKALGKALPGSVKEMKTNKSNQSAFSIDREVINKFKKANKTKTLLTKDN